MSLKSNPLKTFKFIITTMSMIESRVKSAESSKVHYRKDIDASWVKSAENFKVYKYNKKNWEFSTKVGNIVYW